MSTTAIKPALPSAAELDKLAAQHLELQAAKDAAYEAYLASRDRLVDLVKAHGTVPPKASKSLRLSTEDFQLNVSQGHEITVNTERVGRLRKMLRLVAFSKLFRIEVFYVPMKGAKEFIEKQPARIRNAYHGCFEIEHKAPQLDVTRRKKEQVA